MTLKTRTNKADDIRMMKFTEKNNNNVRIINSSSFLSVVWLCWSCLRVLYFMLSTFRTSGDSIVTRKSKRNVPSFSVVTRGSHHITSHHITVINICYSSPEGSYIVTGYWYHYGGRTRCVLFSTDNSSMGGNMNEINSWRIILTCIFKKFIFCLKRRIFIYFINALINTFASPFLLEIK